MTEANIDSVKNLLTRCIRMRNEQRTEAVLRAEFQSRLRQIFPSAEDETWVNHYAEGSEAHTRIGTNSGGTASRFIDNLVHSTIIEYEADLRKTGLREHGAHQVQEYIAGAVRSGTPISQVRGVLSDTVEWYVYDAELASNSIPERCIDRDITLHEIDSFKASDSNDVTARAFVPFLRKHLAREQSRGLSALHINADLGLESLPYRRHVAGLCHLVENGRVHDTSIALATDLWSRFVDGLERAQSGFRIDMYVDELYIAILARLLAANVLEDKAILCDDAGLAEILTGQYFSSRYRLRNMVEDDYFGWSLRPSYLAQFLPIAREIQRDLYAYDFARPEESDLFGHLMAQLARRSQRKLLGQEWTPSWLASELAASCLDRIPSGEDPRIIDMCCGSGSILAAVIREHIHRTGSRSIEHLVNVATGFDIDPLAVMLAKTTWVVALAAVLRSAASDITIPIYHADSLFAATPVSTIPAPGEDSDIRIELDGHSVTVPSELIHPEYRALFDDIIDWAYDEARAATPETGGRIDPQRASTLIQSLIRTHGLSVDEDLQTRIIVATVALTSRMAKLALANRNGIWAFILRNTYRPGLLTGQFNGLVSNPPWLAMSQLAENPYKRQLSQRSLIYGIKPSGASHLHLELATTFLIHAIDRYLHSGAAVACLLPGTIFKGHHQQKFRDAAYLGSDREVPFELQEVWEIAPGTFKVRSAAVVGTKRFSVSEVAMHVQGFRVAPGERTGAPFQVLRTDSRTAWAVGDVGSTPSSDSGEPVPPQGADLMPRAAVCIEVLSKTGNEYKVRTPRQGSELYFAVKDGKQLKGAAFEGFVGKQFLFPMVQSLNLLPFAIQRPLATIAIPAVRKHSGAITILNQAEIRALGLRQSTRWFERIDQTIAQRDAGKPLAERINERNKLTNQILPAHQFLVLSGAGGEVACGACLAIDECKNAVIDQTLYWRVVASADEAWYRVGMLNSNAITAAITAFNPEGEFGGRHPHTLPHRFTPKFDAANRVHLRIAQLARELGEKAQEILEAQPKISDPNKSIASRRLKLRKVLQECTESKVLERECAKALGIAAD